MTKLFKISVILIFSVANAVIHIYASDEYRKNYPQQYQELTGNYTLSPNRTIVIGLVFRGHLYYKDTATGRSGRINLIKDDSFQDESGETKVRFSRGNEGSPNGLYWTQGDAGLVFAPKVKLNVRKINFKSKDASLSGTLVLPPKKDDYPVVIVQGGSSWRIQEDVVEDVYRLVSFGFGAFCYDKRGWGDSTGEQIVDFQTTANDIIAAIQTLKMTNGVDPKKVGLWGISQSGWTVPLAASQSKEAAFIILISPGITFPYRQELQRIEATLRADGFAEDEIRKAINLMQLKINFARTGKNWDEYYSALLEAKDKKWNIGAGGPDKQDDFSWQWIRMNFFYNPIPALQRTDCPVLVLFGEYDTLVLPEVHRSVLELALDSAGNKDVTIKLIPKANHILTEVNSPKSGDILRPRRVAPGVWETVVEWLKKKMS